MRKRQWQLCFLGLLGSVVISFCSIGLFTALWLLWFFIATVRVRCISGA